MGNTFSVFPSTIRHGYAAAGGCHNMDVYVGNGKIKIMYRTLLDPILHLLSLIPLIGLVVDFVNYFRDAFTHNHRDLSWPEPDDNREFKIINLSVITNVNVVSKTLIHRKILRIVLWFPLMDLFVFSLGDVVVKIKTIENEKSKSYKIIFPDSIDAENFITLIREYISIESSLINRTTFLASSFGSIVNNSFALLVLFFGLKSFAPILIIPIIIKFILKKYKNT